jgi:large subunit ribosomal protein L25
VITISAISLPEGARPTIDRDFVIANLSAPGGISASEEEEAEAETGDAPAEDSAE